MKDFVIITNEQLKWDDYSCRIERHSICAAGFKRVVSIDPTPAQRERWGGDWQIANAMYQQAGIELVLL